MEITALSPQVKSKQGKVSTSEIPERSEAAGPVAAPGGAGTDRAGPAGGNLAGTAPGRQTQPLINTARAQESVAMQTNGNGYDFLSISWEKWSILSVPSWGGCGGKGDSDTLLVRV